jgi:ATP-binding cassette subfamily B protein/subfamily B ATP-binding cassette protein MsbA
MKKVWWLRLSRHALQQKSGLALILVLMVLNIGVEALKPWPMKFLVDSILTHQPLPNSAAWLSQLPGWNAEHGAIVWIAGGTILVFVVGQLLGVMQGYIAAGVGGRLTYALGAEVFDHLQHLSLVYHGGQRTGDLVRRVTADSGCARALVMSVFIPLMTSLLGLTTMFLIMWRMDQTLSLVAVGAVLPLFLVIKWLSKPMEQRTYRQQQVEGEMMALAEQNLSALPLIQAFGREPHEDTRFKQLSQRTVQAYLQALFTQLQFKIGVGTVTAIGTAAIILVGGLHVLRGHLSVGSLIVFLSYLASLYVPVEGLAYVSSGFASAAGSARRVMEVLDTDDQIQERTEAIPLPKQEAAGTGRHVRLENVTFGYKVGRPILQNISLEANPGENIALIGATGAGKSTLVSLIPRFFDPWEGRVTLDGIDLRDLQLKDLRSQVAMVLQAPLLLPLTIAENIAYGRPDASREEIEAAARAANSQDFIERLPHGYDTTIGERGATLSGGERQRLSIARALLKDAPLLILDEPTAALDAHTESLLLEALERLMQGRTTLIIAHRLSTIRNANKIIVLDHGQIIEQGNHQQLVQAQGSYWRFYTQQSTMGASPQKAMDLEAVGNNTI